MLYRLVCYDGKGEIVDLAEVSADWLRQGDVPVLCPVEGTLTTAEGAAMAKALHDSGITHFLVLTRPMQLYKLQAPVEAG